MPTQYTTPIAGTARDPAGRDHAVVVASETEDGLSEKPTAGLPAILSQIVLILLQRCWHAFLEHRQRERLRVPLHELSERELTDIGVTRAEIEYIAAQRAFDRLRENAADPWMR